MGATNRLIARYRGWEYWNTYVFEFPLYIFFILKLFFKGLGIRDLCKANWALDHGGFAFASKYEIQNLFKEDAFPKTILIDSASSIISNIERIKEFQKDLRSPFPIILKPDNGRIGKGVVKAKDFEEVKKILALTEGQYLVQEYCDLTFEAGVFFYRLSGTAAIFSINSKELPHVIGDGVASIAELTKNDLRLARFSAALSEQIDQNYIPARAEVVRLSYVGNHSQGSVFRSLSIEDSSDVINNILNIIGELKGFNYGRLDIIAADKEDFVKGNFKVIEVNGIDSLSTDIFDPSWSIIDAYRQLYRQYNLLVEIAYENRNIKMLQLPWIEIFRKTTLSEQQLDQNHRRLLSERLR